MRLELEKLTKTFENQLVLDQVSASFEKGKIYGLVGRNGSGKTTLFNCISQDLRFDSGRIYIQEAGNQHDCEALDVGYVYTTPHLPNFMTAPEFLYYFRKMNQKNLRNPQKSIAEYLDEVGILQGDRSLLMSEYSHGMKNKIQLSLALMTAPKIILLDEPLVNLDPVAVKHIKKLILEIKKDSVIIFSTHILQLAQELCDELYLLHNKKLRHFESSHLKDEQFEDEVVFLLQEGGGMND